MKIKALWGFVGNAELLGAVSAQVKSGQEFENVDDEYAHVLLGKGLVVELDANGKPKAAKPKNTKPAAPNEDKAAADKAAAEKAAAEKAAADKAAADNADKEAK
ncbi:hypothetical protein [Pseudomonas sp. 58(2021)]|uniref:hypothetical protein n=1 Tax=Pseudomonas sp. 58(2021) TaxID=2813330 RepID=UPI001A9E30E2|nr:hypothetical protein [Pseudomonas sp. 58(2021)]